LYFDTWSLVSKKRAPSRFPGEREGGRAPVGGRITEGRGRRVIGSGNTLLLRRQVRGQVRGVLSIPLVRVRDAAQRRYRAAIAACVQG